MIFGGDVLVDDKGGLTSPNKVNEEWNHPEYEYRMASLSMSSNDVLVISKCDVSQHIYDSSPLKRGDYTHHKNMFEKDMSLSRYIKASIDMESISDRIYCVSVRDGVMVAINPSQIRISIREIQDGNTPDIYCGEFYFNDADEKREYPFNDGDNSLSISLNLSTASFSQIFDGLKNGDNRLEVNVSFPAYADWLDSVAGAWPTTYIIKPESNDENFICLSSISSTRNSKPAKEEESKDEADLYDEVDEADEKIELKDVNASIAATNELLLSHSINAKRMSTYLAIMSFCLALLTIKVFL